MKLTTKQKRGTLGTLVIMLLGFLEFFAENKHVISPVVHGWVGVDMPAESDAGAE